MNKLGILLLVFTVFCGVTAQAGIVSVGLDYVPTSYDNDTEQLTIAGEYLGVFLIYSDQPQDGFFGATFNMTSTLDSGYTFVGGDFSLTNNDQSIVYLSGTVETIVFDYSDTTGTLSGSGTAEILVENLVGNLLGPAEIVTISFNLDNVVDFSESFTGLSKINILVPEPATMTLLGLGGILLRRKK